MGGCRKKFERWKIIDKYEKKARTQALVGEMPKRNKNFMGVSATFLRWNYILTICLSR